MGHRLESMAGTERPLAHSQNVDLIAKPRTRCERSMTLNRSFWKGRRVFLTGHTGFKGSWLSLWLHSLGAEVTGYALDPPTEPNLSPLTSSNAANVLHSLRKFATLRILSRTGKWESRLRYLSSMF